MSDAATTFEPHRRFLVGVAYRMLGSVAEAEDVVQDSYLRWEGVERAAVQEPRAYLARIVTRLCLDRLKSARAHREEYVGTWLPEPIVEEPGPTEVADDLSVALLMTLERLSPLERAAFLLHDVFDMDYAQIAGVLERSEAACRQLATRAREHVRDERPRFQPTREAEEKLTAAFALAMASGDTAALGTLLAHDAVLYTDGGGKLKAALNPIYTRDNIVRFFQGILKKDPTGVQSGARPARINGLPGFILRGPLGAETISIETSGEQIVAIYLIRNPDKTKHVPS